MGIWTIVLALVLQQRTKFSLTKPKKHSRAILRNSRIKSRSRLESMYRVALLIETSSRTGREMLRGIFRYARFQGSWSIHLLPGGKLDQTLPAMRAWHGTGIIARVMTRAMENAILESKVPFVVFSPNERERRRNHPFSRYPAILANQMEIGRITTDYLYSCGYRHFAFVGGLTDPNWSHERGEAFRHFVEKIGSRCSIYWRAPRNFENWGLERPQLARWLKALPKPAGILTPTDARGQQVVEACRAAKLRVPEDVGVIGVGNDEIQCELMDLPLSSMSMNTELAGYKAAAALQRLMEGQTRNAERIYIEPSGIIRRKSTERSGGGDQYVAAAIHFIWARANSPIQVSEVVEHVGLSRRSLEQRFLKAVGKTLHKEILEARLDKVKTCLRDTRLSVTQIAKSLGFSSGSYLARLCKSYFGATPEAWRRRHVGP